MDGEIITEFFGEIFFRIFLVILKGIWVCLLWIFNLCQIPYMSIWEKPTKAWRGGLALVLMAIAFLMFLIFN
jgi:hypothetical protein